MLALNNLKKKIIWSLFSYNYKKLIKKSPEKILQNSEKKLIKILKYTTKKTNFYSNLYNQKNINVFKINSIEEFKQKIPVINKIDLFHNSEFRDISKKNQFENAYIFRTSSGYLSKHSYSIESKKNRITDRINLDFLLNKIFNIPLKKTILINTLPLGYDIYTETIPIAITGVRADSVCSLIMKLKRRWGSRCG